MLKFTDDSGFKHVFELDKFVHVHVRESENKKVTLTMHMVGPHTIPVTVNEATANQVLKELGNHNALEYRP